MALARTRDSIGLSTIQADLGSENGLLPNEWLPRGNGCSYTASIPPVRFGGWDAEPPSGGSCALWASTSPWACGLCRPRP